MTDRETAERIVMATLEAVNAAIAGQPFNLDNPRLGLLELNDRLRAIDAGKIVDALTAARASSPPAWRREPPTVEEVRSGLTWWWWRYQRTDDEDRPVIESGVSELFARGDTVRERLRGDLTAPNVKDAACEWSPCLPPSASPPSPGLVEAARNLSNLLDKRGYFDLQCANGIALGIDVDFLRAILALRAALPKEKP